jgi:oxaloacetate decarboxylase (Na+ extruding) subunit gamma
MPFTKLKRIKVDFLTQALNSFFLIMGVVSSILLIVGFVLKARGTKFVEFFPKEQESVVVPPSQNITYNTYNTTSGGINPNLDARKVAAIMAAIEHHTRSN